MMRFYVDWQALYHTLLAYAMWICGLKTPNISKQFLLNYLTPDKGCITKS